MNLQKNILSLAITSLLCVGQNVLAAATDPITSTITLNGVTRTINFASQDELNRMISAPTSAEIGLFSKVNADGSISSPTSATGMVSQSEINGVPVTLVKTDSNNVAFVQSKADGTTEIVTINRSADSNATLADGKPASLNNLVKAYVDVSTNPAATVDPIFAETVKSGANAATLATVKDDIAQLATSEVKPTVDVVSAETAPVAKTDSASTVAALVNKQVAIASLASVNSVVAVAAPAAATVTAGNFETTSLSQVVQVEAASNQVDAAKSVLTTLKADSTQAALVVFAKEEVAVSSNKQVDAVVTLSTSVINSTTATSAEKEAALTNLTTSLETQDAAIKEFVADPNASSQVKTEAVAQVSTSTTALIGLASTVAADPNASVAAKESALANLQTVLSTQNAALGAVTNDPNVSAADKQAAQAAATASAQQAVTTTTAVTTAIVNDPNASAEQKAAAQQALVEVTAAAEQINTGGVAVSSALATAETAISAANAIKSINSAKVAAFNNAKELLAQDTTSKASQIITIREQALLPNRVNFGTTLTTAQAAVNTALKDTTITAAQKQDLQNKVNDLTALQTAQTQLLANTQTAEYFAEKTSANGIAGNPSSMMNIMVDTMFSQGSDDSNASVANIAASSDNGIRRSFDVGLNYNYYNLTGTSANVINLPLSYTTKFDSKSQLILTLPLSYINQSDNSNADSYQVGAGIAYKYNVTDFWTISPAFNFAHRMVNNSGAMSAMTNGVSNAVLSGYDPIALGDGVSMYGGSLTNKFDANWSGMKISLTNMNGYFETVDGLAGDPTGASGYSNTISNYVLKNGISVAKNVGGFNASTYFTDTEYFESKVFYDQINEFGFALKPEAASGLKVSMGYLFSFKNGPRGDLDGFKLNLNYNFK